MSKLEASVSKMKNSFERWSQEYEQQVKQRLELQHDKKVRDDISTLNLLRCYSNALRMCMDLRPKDAIQEMESYSGFPDDQKATPHEIAIKGRMKSLLEELKRLNPTSMLKEVIETLRVIFQAEPSSWAILNVRIKKHAYAVRDWVHEDRELQALIKVTISYIREASPAGIHQAQEEAKHIFRNGETNLLIVTSEVEELDFAECTLFSSPRVSSEVQTEGRARAENAHSVKPASTLPLSPDYDASNEVLSKKYSLKLNDRQEVWEYQKELAGPGINGENYIIVAPIGSGKTVAALVISDHLQKNQHHLRCHVVFVVSTKPLAEQQKILLAGFIPDAGVVVYTEDTENSIKIRNNIISVCTAEKLLDEIQKGHIKFDEISLIVFDECHHARKGHPYVKLMEHYLKYRGKELQYHFPQIIGMTNSPAAGENFDLDRKKTIHNLLKLAATFDASSGFKTVTENVVELQPETKRSHKTLTPQKSSSNLFIGYITGEMVVLEAMIPSMKKSFEKGSQEYNSLIQQVKQPLELVHDKSARDTISTLNLLYCYSNSLQVYMDLEHKEAIEEMERYTGFPEDDNIATPHEITIKRRMKDLLEKLKQLTPAPSPLLVYVVETLRDAFQAEPTSQAVIVIRTNNREHAYSLCNWIREHCELQTLIKPDVITHTSRSGSSGSMTQKMQEEVMKMFRAGKTNLLITTPALEEDIPECNLVIKFQPIPSALSQVQDFDSCCSYDTGYNSSDDDYSSDE